MLNLKVAMSTRVRLVLFETRKYFILYMWEYSFNERCTKRIFFFFPDQFG